MNPLALPVAPALPRFGAGPLLSMLLVWLFVLLLSWRAADGDEAEGT